MLAFLLPALMMTQAGQKERVVRLLYSQEAEAINSLANTEATLTSIHKTIALILELE